MVDIVGVATVKIHAINCNAVLCTVRAGELATAEPADSCAGKMEAKNQQYF